MVIMVVMTDLSSGKETYGIRNLQKVHKRRSYRFHGSQGPDPGYGVVAKFVEVGAVTDREVKADGASFPFIPAAGDLLHGMFLLTPVEPDRSDAVARPEDGGDPDMFPYLL